MKSARIRHGAAAALAAQATTLLDAVERRRLARILSPAQGRAKAAAWALRRLTLSEIAPRVAPQDWLFTYDAQGRPLPVRLPDGRLVHHSLSTSGGLCMVMTAAAPCGVDIEVAGPLPEAADAVLADGEYAMLRRADDPVRCFTRLWTAKEAAAKRIGTGFLVDPHLFEVRWPGEGGEEGAVLLPGGMLLSCRWSSPAESVLACAVL